MQRWTAMSCKGSVYYDRCKYRCQHAPNQVALSEMQKTHSSQGFRFPMRPAQGSTVSTKGWALNLVTVKNFLRFYIATSCDENERPTTESVNLC